MKQLKLLFLSALLLSLVSCVLPAGMINLPGQEFWPEGDMTLAELNSGENKGKKLGVVYFTSKMLLRDKEQEMNTYMYYKIIKKTNKKRSMLAEDEDENPIQAMTYHQEKSGMFSLVEAKGHQPFALMLPEGEYLMTTWEQKSFSGMRQQHNTGDLNLSFRITKGKAQYGGSLYFVIKRRQVKIYYKNSSDKVSAILKKSYPDLFQKNKKIRNIPKKKTLLAEGKLEDE